MEARPACQKGVLVPGKFEPEETLSMAKNIIVK